MDTPQVQRQRRPRFARATPPPFRITERDIAILREIAAHKVMTSMQISKLLDAPHKKICERLARLYHAAYIERPRAQLAYHIRGGGSTPMIYILAPRGAHFLIEAGDADATHVHVVAADSRQLFLLHAFAVTDFRVALQIALRERPSLKLIDGAALPAASAAPMRVTLAGGAVVAIMPDYAFTLHRSDNGAVRNYFVEVDRGSMPVERQSLMQSSILRKVMSYSAIHAQGRHKHQYGWRAFRVLIITTNSDRATHIRDAISRANAGHADLFKVFSNSEFSIPDLLAQT